MSRLPALLALLFAISAFGEETPQSPAALAKSACQEVAQIHAVSVLTRHLEKWEAANKSADESITKFLDRCKEYVDSVQRQDPAISNEVAGLRDAAAKALGNLKTLTDQARKEAQRIDQPLRGEGDEKCAPGLTGKAIPSAQLILAGHSRRMSSACK